MKQEKYKGNLIELPKDEECKEITINGVKVQFGKDSSGEYFLSLYAYDRDADLLNLVKKYVDYQAKNKRPVVGAPEGE